MKNKLIKINKNSLIRLYNSKLSSSEGFESIGITYISNNPIISYIWWSRLQAMIDLASKVKAEKVLDFGCGEGVLLPSLSNIYKEVHAADLDVRTAHDVKNEFKLSNVKIFQDDIFKSNLENNCYDIIFAASVLEHFKDIEIVLKNLKQKLKKGGMLVFSCPSENYIYKIGRFLSGYNKYSGPQDIHYYGAREIAEKAKTEYKLLNKLSLPIKILPFINLHNVYLFKNE